MLAYNRPSAEDPVALSRIGPLSPLMSAILLAIAPAILGLVTTSCAPSQTSDPIAVVQAAFDRLAEGDVDGYLAYFAEDAIFLDEHGGPTSRVAVREALAEAVANEYRWEIRDLTSDGNVVTYNTETFWHDASFSRSFNAVDVVLDGKIIFDGWESGLLAECKRDPSQAFCMGD